MGPNRARAEPGRRRCAAAGGLESDVRRVEWPRGGGLLPGPPGDEGAAPRFRRRGEKKQGAKGMGWDREA